MPSEYVRMRSVFTVSASAVKGIRISLNVMTIRSTALTCGGFIRFVLPLEWELKSMVSDRYQSVAESTLHTLSAFLEPSRRFLLTLPFVKSKPAISRPHKLAIARKYSIPLESAQRKRPNEQKTMALSNHSCTSPESLNVA